MPGIAVIYDPSNGNEEIEALIPRMCQALQRSDLEGPVEWYSGPGFGIGRCRPALVNQVSQPAWNEERTVCALFHGELFGHQDLGQVLERRGHRFSDSSHAEFVVHLYEDRGDAFIHELNGSFALAVWDSREERLLLANDRYALCPLYTALSGGKFLWASSPKGILADTTFPRRINLAALADFFALCFPQGNDTMFDGIDELPPASLVICQEGQVRCERYWDWSLQEDETGISADDYLDALIPILKRAAERRQTDGVRPGLLLSGGLDSRVILSILRKDAVRTFTFGPPYCDDVKFARQVAQVANVPHVALEIKPDYLETFAWIGIGRMEDLVNCDQFHSIGVYDQIAAQVDCLITGSAGEDIFGEFDQDPRSEFWGEGFSVDRYFDSKCLMTDQYLRHLFRPVYFEQMKGVARARFCENFEGYASRHVTNKQDVWYIKQQHRRRSNRLSSLFPDDLVFRPVFYDNDVVDFAQTVPPSLRWGESALYRQVVLRIAPDLARLPATTTRGLPLGATHEQIGRRARRRKSLAQWRRTLNRLNIKITKGLVPPIRKTTFYADYHEWLRRDLRGWMESILLDPRTLNREYWYPSAITQLVQDHLRGERGVRAPARKLTALISFELWHRMYLDELGVN